MLSSDSGIVNSFVNVSLSFSSNKISFNVFLIFFNRLIVLVVPDTSSELLFSC